MFLRRIATSAHLAAISCFLIGLLALTVAPVRAAPLTTYVTGEDPGLVLVPGAPDSIVFRVDFDPSMVDSGVISLAVHEATGAFVDGIDFVPGTGNSELVVGAQTVGDGAITHYNVTGTLFAPYVPSTNAVAVAPAPGGTKPSTTFSTPTHVNYIENQFGFGGTTSDRIMRAPFAGGAEEVVFGGVTAAGGSPIGASVSLENLEGIEVVDAGGGPRLYFFAADHSAPGFRALYSIALLGTGLGDTTTVTQHIGSLAASGGGDGSDELDLDPSAPSGGAGLIFGTNIFNGEVIAWDPVTMMEVIPGVGGSTMHFIDGAAVAGSLDPFGLTLLGRKVDGIRSTGDGFLVFAAQGTGPGGVIGSIDIGGVLGDGADDGDIIRLYEASAAASGHGTGFFFDDLTPLTTIVPEPSTFGLALMALIGLCLWGRKSPRR